MIPVFVISLPDCKGRREKIAASLDDLGIKFEFVDAVDGREGLPPEYEVQIDREAARKAGRIMCDAEFACALSHIKVYRRIVADNIDHAVVLEDDAIPTPQLAEYLSGAFYRDSDMTHLGYLKTRIYVRRGGVKQLVGNHKSYLSTSLKPICGAYGYIVSREAAKHFIELNPVIDRQSWLNVETLVSERKYRIVSPALVLHPPLFDEGQSLLDKAGRVPDFVPSRKRRFIGIYVPPFRKIVGSNARGWRKLIYRRLRHIEDRP